MNLRRFLLRTRKRGKRRDLPSLCSNISYTILSCNLTSSVQFSSRCWLTFFSDSILKYEFSLTKEMADSTKILVESHEEDVILRLTKLLKENADEAIARDDIFKIGLSGGSLVNLLVQGLPNITTDWSKWRFFFCDERVVPFDNGESTFGQYKTNLIGKVPITEEQFIKIDPELSAEEAARDYIKKMSVYFPPDSLPRFDVLLLGLGPDGHTCSLFPEHKLLDETSLWVCPINDSPKPPLCRITFTFPVINNAKVCIFAVVGSSKAKVVEKILKNHENLPAAGVQPINGSLYWILDQNAAKFLNLNSV